MSRSGYVAVAIFDRALNLYRANVDRALAGKRGQKLLRELRDALEAMPEKRLIARNLEKGGEVCALGALGRARGLRLAGVDPEDVEKVAGMFGVAECVVREVTYENDEVDEWTEEATPERRHAHMLAWARAHIKP